MKLGRSYLSSKNISWHDILNHLDKYSMGILKIVGLCLLDKNYGNFGKSFVYFDHNRLEEIKKSSNFSVSD